MAFPYKQVLMIGATSGIGAALDEKFISQGISVVAVGRRKEILDEFVAKHGRDKISSIVFDITKLKDIPQFAEDAFNQYPEIDLVFLNSGIQRTFNFAKPESVDLDVIDSELLTNYTAFVHLTKAFLPLLQKRAQSSPVAIAFTTSGLALIPASRCLNYSASKAALHAFIQCVREQLQSEGSPIKVIELVPPAVQTELHNEKNQPDMKGRGPIGIPIDEFTEEAWAGLESGADEIPIGVIKSHYRPEGFETKRKEHFNRLAAMLRVMK